MRVQTFSFQIRLAKDRADTSLIMYYNTERKTTMLDIGPLTVFITFYCLQDNFAS